MIAVEIQSGQRYGQLTVLTEVAPVRGRKNGRPVQHRAVRVRCDCGTVKVVRLSNLRAKTRSCGCVKAETMREVARQRFTIHGASGHPLFKLWQHMMDRCNNPRSPRYEYWGGRGIRVCERWHNPWAFITDIEQELGLRPEDAHPSGWPVYSLDRINNDGDYEPGNVRWATSAQQNANNRRWP